MSKRKPVLLYTLGTASLLGVIGGVGGVASQRTAATQKEAEARKTTAADGPRIEVTTASMSPGERRIELQGEARPFASVTLYAKVSGYLKQIYVDKGDRVKANQVMAIIESPEVDRQFDAAMADARYKRTNADRAAALAKPGVVAQSEAEVQVGQAQVAEANVQALAQQKAYETLRAPFAGTVTARFADPGALVQNAMNAQTGALPVVTVSQTEKLRVYVYVDQRDAGFVHVGDEVEVAVPDSTVKVKAKVTRLADELDPKTRTMLVETDVDNRDNQIVAGSFVWVTLKVKAQSLVQVPAAAVTTRESKDQVAVVRDGRLKWLPVQVADDDGALVRIAHGLAAGTEVALHAGELPDGAKVQPVMLNGGGGAAGR